MTSTLGQLAAHVGGEVVGDPSLAIRGVQPIERAEAGYLTFVSNSRYIRRLKTTKASAVIVSPDLRDIGKPVIVVSNPYLAFAQLVEFMMGEKESYSRTVHPDAAVAESAQIGKDVTIFPHAYVGERTSIGDRAVLYPGAFVDHDCTVGEDTVIHANCSVYAKSQIGKRVVLHANVAVGSSGFGYAPDGERYHKIPQVGRAVIEDDVDVGSNTTINRGALGDTIIHRGTKIDSCAVISHNVEIGENSLIVSQVGIAGTVKIGRHVTLAGQVGVAGHIEIGDNVTVGAQSGIAHDVAPGQILLGTPVAPIADTRRAWAALSRLPEMRATLRDMQRKIEQLEAEIQTLRGQSA